MPTPARTSLDEIVAAGRTILERDGLDGLTMQAVADVVGVRAPSLYKRVRDRGDLVRLIADDVARELVRILDAAATSADPRRNLVSLAHAFRAFARASPEAYGLIFARLPEAARPDRDLTAAASEAVVHAAAGLAGDEHALEAARTIVAWAHGFISMELAGAFRLGGDVDQAFDYGVERLASAIDARGLST
jgi:AcrR family transcriptional regulator